MSQKILLSHGSGGKLMNEFINEIIREILGPQAIQLDDSAVLKVNSQIAFTTDSFTVDPIFFPGGDIGKLAVNGTVNDLAVMGAEPLYLSCALILEEGLELDVLKKILFSMREAAEYAGVKIVTGDTKVVESGKVDKIFINTAGIGIFKKKLQRGLIKPDDKVIINGSIGEHGIAVIAKRNNIGVENLVSDCAPLNHLIKKIIDICPEGIKFMRDATRGGLAAILNEIVQDKKFSIKLYEERIPVKEEVRGICELLGLDPLYVANEGKVVVIVAPECAKEVLLAMKEVKEGKEAVVIGEVTEEFPGSVYLETVIGSKRPVPMPIGEQLPRIC
ncbi:MAG: Carbamoyl dehydratase HypE [Thermodesulfobacterium sp.]|uniref:Carbamoyl dehydratase HypE n=1 Tax=Candidatus Thermodesulfobacterium syntrophicum TaxID=3060442 RepID=A0AAE3P2Y5_9BACT|nr:Carbamoyl dehydratase HypE [Candidatus Thermodesulfobacterium syntrophicum]